MGEHLEPIGGLAVVLAALLEKSEIKHLLAGEFNTKTNIQQLAYNTSIAGYFAAFLTGSGWRTPPTDHQGSVTWM
jgi:hypothetical protein